MPLLLLFSVFVVATCGLIYELVAGTLASYLLGDSITQFSTIIGLYLFAMGIGSYLSRFFNTHLLSWFIQLEILIGLVGGSSAALLFLSFEFVESFRVLLYLLVLLTGTMVGLEIPLLMRILKDRFEFKDLVSRVFTFDYVGALLASLVFPLFLVPFLGLMKTSFMFGIFNVAVAYLLCVKFKEEIAWSRYLKVKALASMLFLLLGFVFSEKLMQLSDALTYEDKVIYSTSSPYQRIVLTKRHEDVRLFLNGNLQFSSRDEYRYHEALVHPGMSKVASPQRILVLGGGDGLAVRELLRYPEVRSVTLVDLDPKITQLFSTNSLLVKLNDNSLKAPRVQVVNEDAFEWVKKQKEFFDFVVIDFPDPSNFSIGKLYTNTFYKQLKKLIAPGGVVTVQSTSPFVAPKSYWCVNKTLQSCGYVTLPYHAYIPSFGDWGYVMAWPEQELKPAARPYPPGLRFVNDSTFRQLCAFPKDMPRQSVEVNRLNNQILVHYFEHEWAAYIH